MGLHGGDCNGEAGAAKLRPYDSGWGGHRRGAIHCARGQRAMPLPAAKNQIHPLFSVLAVA